MQSPGAPKMMKTVLMANIPLPNAQAQLHVAK